LVQERPNRLAEPLFSEPALLVLPRRSLVDSSTKWYTAEFQLELDAVNDAVNDTFEKLARVHLLFGDLPSTGLAATAICDHLRNMDSVEPSPGLDSRYGRTSPL
jgi:hypothetical protein